MASMKQLVGGVMIIAIVAAIVIGAIAGQEPTINGGANMPNEANTVAEAPPDAYEQLFLLPEGSIAPRFQAKTASGETLALDALLNQGKGAVLVFYQGLFCSVCAQQLEGFQQHYNQFQNLGYEVIAISADDPSQAQERQGKSGLSFPVVPDAPREIIAEYGVANVTRANIAYPTVYVVNDEGKIQYHFADALMSRLEADKLLDTLRAMQSMKPGA